MAKIRTFDSTVTQAEAEAGIATKVGRMVREASVILQDDDDACQQAGKEFGEWILHITDTEVFKATIKSILGHGKFNEEFFLDGLKEAIKDSGF